MKILSRHAAHACLINGVLLVSFSFVSHAAVPEIAVETDPLISLLCSKQLSGSLTISGATTSASSISDAGVSLYQAGFNKATWSGSLKKYRLGFDEFEGEIKIASVAEWDAADILTGVESVIAKPAPEARHIYTSMNIANQPSLTMPFLWNNLSIAQMALLHTSPVTGNDDQLGEKRLDYLRGGRQYELGNAGGIFRKRDRVLGAIVHSSPVFVGAPSVSLQGSDYPAFYEAHKTRRSAVYVGASDGMLHGFDAVNGEELFAYVPQALFKNLSSLTRDGGVYRPFVDGAITVAETRVANQWKTILASGMGGGAQGVFALDVTAPDQFEKGLGALWEFTDADDVDMGNVVGAPLIARFRIKIVKGVPSYRDFVVVAAGLNNYRDDGVGKFNLQAPGALFLLALDKSKSEPWKIGTNYFKFVIPISDKMLANGLTAPASVPADDGSIAYIYSGDLQGNLWRFDFSGNAPWPNAVGGTSTKPVFVAMDAQRNRQAITQKVQVVYAPYGGYLVLFGTGKFIEAADMDAARFKMQSFYAVLDALDGKTVTRNQLLERKLMPVNSSRNMLEINGGEVKYGLPANGDKGWYLDFLDANKTGERSIGSARVSDGILFFNTLIPNSDPCQVHGGRRYILNTLNGLPVHANLSAELSNTVLSSTPMVMAIVPEQAPRDATGKRRVKKKLEVLDPVVSDKQGTSAPVPKAVTETSTLSGRLSWREIVNWVELRTSIIKK
ncbi:pilus assembly protein [Herminiimonas fonticola]|uniref:Type IV pilus assembly protein PilY1 n=1 Tax=Herminiimonas fonticola TaxID=303380 RepID=A0A4R6G635_9BURK|nr:PilC/PilY family type IV pilus protein [Herminiimonas fonticola]RBA23937.1 Neisseria PilC beta-propeller domain [Herminiimonas fonticola]TDN89937.1 type IV pilus assembly protein PilY1 [Herminiimonas fonticola]